MPEVFPKQNNVGITLIETVVYIALFAIIIGGAITAAYSMIESQGRNQTQGMVEEEGNFILEKIDWALTGATAVSVSASSQFLINRDGISDADNPLIFYNVGGNMYMERGVATSTQLNNSNVTITNTVFTNATSSYDGIVPESAGVTFTANVHTPNGLLYSETFSTVKYLRK
jgi:type II secretory pathway pseudopilin PulG